MHEDIEFSDTPVSEGIAYNDLGRIESYVLTLENKTIALRREKNDRGDFIVIEDDRWTLHVPMPIIEAMMRLDLAALVPAKEAKEEE